MSRKLTIGLFGFGVVGQGLHDIIETKDLNLEIKKIVIRDPAKERSLPASLFTTDASQVLNDPEINTVVELINDAEAAYHIVTTALRNGKNVVSANKKMIASHLEELVELQKKHNVSLLYEGAVCGSIPIIRNLEEYYDNELLHSISGIFNENQDYSAALKKAQDLGFAETDPTLDVGGFDPKFKLTIATAHAYGLFLNPDEILNIGIQNFSALDLQYAREKNLKIKLVPTARKIDENTLTAYVLPKLIASGDFLFNVENEYNGVTVQAAFADQQFFFGKGAGGHPTGSAVLSDIAALRYDYRYEYKKHHNQELKYSTDVAIKVYLRYRDEELLTRLNLTDVSERFYATDFRYIIGSVRLEKLIEHQEELRRSGIFLAEVVSPNAGQAILTEEAVLEEEFQ
ncbi:MAG TPA: homoserine dehydrogenase [Sphingobacteriaceae bacterium]